MWVESVPTKGSTFHFTLRLEACPGSVQPSLEGVQPQLANLRLLVVEDNSTNCRLLELQGRKWGMIPRSTESAAQALDWFRAGEVFDLAILDMQLPGMDGLTLAGEVRKLPGGSALPLVLLTSVGVRTDHPDFARLAIASCLTKPLKPAQLHQVLMRVVSGTKPAANQRTSSPKLDPTLARRLPLRVLLCDDNAINQKVAQRLLQQMGYRTDLAANGLEALAALDRQPYDLVFMDVMMPEMDGFEATRIIRERQRQSSRFPNYQSSIIVVAMTASAMQGDREKCLGAGMDDYIAKPIRLEDVRTIMERWGPSIGPAETPGTNGANAQSAPADAGSRANGAATAEEAPVDMDRLLEFTDGSADNLRELVELYLSQTAEQMEQLAAAVRGGDAAEVRRLAHSCAGASSTCGMRRLAPMLRELERKGLAGELAGAAPMCRDAGVEFERIRGFLQAYLLRHPDPIPKL